MFIVISLILSFRCDEACVCLATLSSIWASLVRVGLGRYPFHALQADYLFSSSRILNEESLGLDRELHSNIGVRVHGCRDAHRLSDALSLGNHSRRGSFIPNFDEDPYHLYHLSSARAGQRCIGSSGLARSPSRPL